MEQPQSGMWCEEIVFKKVLLKADIISVLTKLRFRGNCASYPNLLLQFFLILEDVVTNNEFYYSLLVCM